MQVYLGRWHSSEVAIKCLNPSLFFSGSDGSASNAAMDDLLREADLLASLRHPNVVWVYGVVLPRMVRLSCSCHCLCSLTQSSKYRAASSFICLACTALRTILLCLQLLQHS